MCKFSWQKWMALFMCLNIEVTLCTKRLLWSYLLVWRRKKKEDRIFLKLEHLNYFSKILLFNDCTSNYDNSVTVVILWKVLMYYCQKLFLQPVTIMSKALTNMVKECVKGVKCIKCILRGEDLWAFSEWYFQKRWSQENNWFDFSNKAQTSDFVQSFQCDWWEKNLGKIASISLVWQSTQYSFLIIFCLDIV